ncbi:LpxI family protein [Candidatus Riflebacteria bacterium]
MQNSNCQSKKLGLIAGNGRFPFFFAEGALNEQYKVIVCSIIGETDPDIEKLVGKDNCFWVHLGELNKLIEILKTNGIERVVMAGKVSKTRLFRDLKMDDRVQDAFAKLPHKSDDALLLAIARELGAEGIELLDSTLFLKKLLVQSGVLTETTPDESQMQDVKFGFSLAKKMGSLDIGQTVVVKDQAVMAIEAIEGTDACIARGSKLGNGNVVVVKVAKPNQDMRFDIPVIGFETVKTLIKDRAKVLAVEAEKVLFLDREKCLELANKHNLAIISLSFNELEINNG